MDGSSFSGLLTRVEIGHMRIGSAGKGRIESRVANLSRTVGGIMQLLDGLAEWRSVLGEIYATAEVRGIEKIVDWAIFFLTILIPSRIAEICIWGGESRCQVGSQSGMSSL